MVSGLFGGLGHCSFVSISLTIRFVMPFPTSMPFPFWYTGIWLQNLVLRLKANFYKICPVASQTYYSEKQGSSEKWSAISAETTAGPAHEIWFTVTRPTAGVISNITYTVLL